MRSLVYIAVFALLTAPHLLAADNAKANVVKEIKDPDISSAITSEMLTDDAVSAHLVDVRTADGIVTLSGVVGSLLEKERAVSIAESTKGVRAVIDRMQVRTPEIGDQRLLNSVKTALAADPATDSYEIAVSAESGKVTLSGTVESWAEAQLSLEVARGVKGVKEVIDDLTVDFKSTRPDAEIKADIERKLESDVWVDESDIRVEVRDGLVVLSGSVGSVAQKRQAMADAWTSGARSVNYDALTVRPFAGNGMKARPGARPSDTRISEAVRDAFLQDPRVLSFNPRVEVTNGYVRLTGTVDNLKAKRAAEEDARNTRGVLDVVNELKVRPATLADDAALADAVRDALLRDPYVDRYRIVVEAVNGKARLSGTVDSVFERSHAEDVASRVNGVVEVDNNLAVEPVTLSVMYKTDAEIRRAIEEQFFWSVFVDGSDIRVEVRNGVAILDGQVDSWAERIDASKNAFEGGARMVLNRLRIG